MEVGEMVYVYTPAGILPIDPRQGYIYGVVIACSSCPRLVNTVARMPGHARGRGVVSMSKSFHGSSFPIGQEISLGSWISRLIDISSRFYFDISLRLSSAWTWCYVASSL